jgi:superfamily II DNA/RNA helicase
VGGIIISPTRELAVQTSQVLAYFLHRVEHITQMLLIGGNSVSADVDCFRAKGANILIATPGRLEDLLMRKCDINLPAAVKSLVCINAHISAFITLLVLFKYVIVFEISLLL